MKRIFMVLIILFFVIIVATASYVFLLTNDNENTNNNNNNGNHETPDTEPPEITDITGDTTGSLGKITTITVDFSDNVAVTTATLFYKPQSSSTWINLSILNRSADITIPSSATEDYEYYVIIDDAAGNGPVGDPSIDGSSTYTISVSLNNNGENIVHTVFIEEGTGTWCSNCPLIADILHELYTEGALRFYYVSLVEDKNSQAKARLEDEYNIYAYPTVFIDGGYDVLVGAGTSKATFEESITRALNRNVPKIGLDITAIYDNNTDEVNVMVILSNFENNKYTGRLRIYLTERNSWPYYGGTGIYHYGLIDFIGNEEVSIASNNQTIVSKLYDVSDLDVENLMIIAALINENAETQYAFPPDQNPFDAYYTDACNGTLVVEGGNLPPEVGITSPQLGKIYINGRERGTLLLSLFKVSHFSNTFVLGRSKTFTAFATDDSNVEKVEFYIDDVLVYTATQEPYEFTTRNFLRPILPIKHTLQVIAYDNEGKTASASIDFIGARI